MTTGNMTPGDVSPGSGRSVQQGRRSRRALISWCFFDWANSAFPTVIVTFVFSAYFLRAVADDVESGTGQWGWMLALSGLAVALLAPVLGAVADQGGPRKPWIGAFTLIAVICAAALWHIAPDPAFALGALILVAVGNGGFELGQVFYNAMLPEITTRARLGRVSGWAWGLGYAGGLTCLALCLVLFVQPPWPLFDLDTAAGEQVRIVGPFVALWFAAFAAPLFFFTPERPNRAPPLRQAISAALRGLWRTVRDLPRHGQIGRFLLARMIYTDGLNTLFAFGGLYAAGTFDMDFQEILIFGILLNVTAGLGAAGFAWFDDSFGAKLTVAIALGALILCSLLVLLVESKVWFIGLGCALGVFVGPAQAASRSLMARLAPAEIRTELFGLYALSGKATAFLGPALVGTVTVWADSQRAGMATIPIFFVIGLLLFLPLRDPER